MDDTGGVPDPGDVWKEKGQASQVAQEKRPPHSRGLRMEGPEYRQQGQKPNPNKNLQADPWKCEMQEDTAEDGGCQSAEGENETHGRGELGRDEPGAGVWAADEPIQPKLSDWE